MKTKASTYLKKIYSEVEDEITYIVEVEGVEIPEPWRSRILQPIDFAIQQQELEENDKQ